MKKGGEKVADSNTIEGQLMELGLDPVKIELLDPFVRYFGNRTAQGFFDTCFTSEILRVEFRKNFIAVLVKHTESENTVPIEMSTKVFVIFDGKVVASKNDLYYSYFYPEKNREQRAFDKIIGVKREGKNFVVRLRCTKSRDEVEIYLPVSEGKYVRCPKRNS